MSTRPTSEQEGRPQGGHATAVIPAARRLAGATAIVGGAFVLSRVLGLVRDIIIAARYGTTDQNDIYVAAFRVPDLLFLLIIGGVVGSAFIPVFTELMARRREEAAWRLTSTAINASVGILLLGCGLLALLAPLLVATVIAPGYDPAKQARIVDLTRIMLLSPLFLGLGGWAQGILNARQHFTLPALAPLAYNGCIILGAVAFTPIWGLEGLAYGVVLGAGMHFLIQVPGLAQVGMRYYFGRIQPADEGAGEVARLFAPRLVGQGAYQANVIAVTMLASFLPAGRLAAFNYAYQLMLLPFGVVALSLATVIFPTLAEQFGRGALDELRATLGRALRVVTFLMVPAAVGLGLLRYQIVAVVLEFGAFSGQSTALVADALGWFAWGLVSYGLLEILTRGAYAMHDTRLPVLLAIGSMAINIALAAAGLFVFHTDHSGLAIALAVSTSLEAAALYAVLHHRLGGIEDRRMLRSTAISLLAAVEMGLVLWGAVPILQTVAPDGGAGKLGGLIVLGGAIALGLGTYVGIARLLQAEELTVAWGLVRRRF